MCPAPGCPSGGEGPGIVWGKLTLQVPWGPRPAVHPALLQGWQATPDVPPSLQIYPDESHYFHSAPLRQHLHRTIVNFFVECFRVQDKVPTATAKEEEED